MRKLILIALIAAAAYAQADSNGHRRPKGPPVQDKTLARAELDQLLATPDKVLLIDVRRPDEVSSIGGFPLYLSIQAGSLKSIWMQFRRTASS
jgi:hypothetical protein